MRTVRKSSFAQLAGYFTNAQDNSERIGVVSITNCHSGRLDDALAEIQAIQNCNTRSTDDKTYHLIVSFPAEEQPSKQVLQAIEQRICEELGFDEHQRVSAVHGDTDNVHVHIAINKIHPTRYTVHTPFNAYWTLARVCERLEDEHGLQKDNHQARKLGPENKAADMERHSGIQSFIGWVQTECLDHIKAAPSWSDLHETLREYGLELKERGNGFVIGDGAGTQAKASSIDRSLSKAQFEKRLGPFEPPRDSPMDPTSSSSDSRGGYEQKPLPSKIDTTELYAQYRQEQQDRSAARTAESRLLRLRHQAELEAARDASRVRRNAIGLMGGDRIARKVLYALVSRALRSELARARARHVRERQVQQQQYVRRVWLDWLQARAAQGDPVALSALRAREGRQGLSGNVISALDSKGATSSPVSAQDHVTKKGTVIYRRGVSAIRDDGDRLQVSRDTDWKGLDAALRMAIQRYGRSLTVTGSDDFKSRVVAAAAAAALPLIFSDTALEQRRLVLSSTLSRKPTHAHPDRRRTHAGGAGTAQPGAAHGDRAGHVGPRPGAVARRGGSDVDARSAGGGDTGASVAFTARDTGRPAQRGKPHVGRVGSQPPPAAKNRLRNLSQLGVVQFARGSEVLLPGDVPGRLEQPDTQSDHALRRPVSGAGGAVAPEDAVDKFIAERHAKRTHIHDIPKYERYTSAVETFGRYAGTRSVAGQWLALLQRDEVVDVLPIDAATAVRLRRFRIGDAVTVQRQMPSQTIGRTTGPAIPNYIFKPSASQTMTLKKARSR